MGEKEGIGECVCVCLPSIFCPYLASSSSPRDQGEKKAQPVAAKPSKVISAILLHYLVHIGVRVCVWLTQLMLARCMCFRYDFMDACLSI